MPTKAHSANRKYEVGEGGVKPILIPGHLYKILSRRAAELNIKPQEFISLCLAMGAEDPDLVRMRYIEEKTGG